MPQRSSRIHQAVQALTTQIVEPSARRAGSARALHIEDIQDQVELALMRSEEHKVARAYVLYREERAQQRRSKAHGSARSRNPPFRDAPDGRTEPLDEQRLTPRDRRGLSPARWRLARSRHGGSPPQPVRWHPAEHEVGLAQTMAARSLVEQEPNYAFVSARLLLNILRDEALRFVLPESVEKGRGRHVPHRLCRVLSGLYPQGR